MAQNIQLSGPHEGFLTHQRIIRETNPKYEISVLPCLLYGRDILTLTKSDIAKINQFHKKFIKQIMHLPDRTADAANFILPGQIPIQGEISADLVP